MSRYFISPLCTSDSDTPGTPYSYRKKRVVTLMSGRDKFQEGDDICRSCTGLLVFTVERQRRGLRPLCMGVPGVAKGRVPKDRLTELNERTKGKLGTYVCFGYSQWTGMMERTGRIPLCINGIDLNIESRYAPKKVKEHKDGKNGKHGGDMVTRKDKEKVVNVTSETSVKTPNGNTDSEGQVKRKSPIPGIMGAPRHHPTQVSPNSSTTSIQDTRNRNLFGKPTNSTDGLPPSDVRLQLESTVSEFTRLLRKGALLQYRRMQDFYHTITTDPGKKVYRSAERIGQSSAKVAGMLQKFWADKWGDL